MDFARRGDTVECPRDSEVKISRLITSDTFHTSPALMKYLARHCTFGTLVLVAFDARRGHVDGGHP